MKLKELLSVTTMDTIIIIDAINSDREKRNITELNARNNMGIILTYAWDEFIKEYGEYVVLNQSLTNGKLEILIKE